MSTKASFAPSCANARAIPRPMPRAPPVINAAFPSMRSMSHLQAVRSGQQITQQINRSLSPSVSYAQLLEQRLGVLQVGGVEALGEPVVDVGEHLAPLVAAIRITQQPAEAGRCTQFPPFERALLRNLDGFTVLLLGNAAIPARPPPFQLSSNSID